MCLVGVVATLVPAAPAAAAWPAEDYDGPDPQSIVVAPGTGGYWTAFRGVGVRGVLGAPDWWQPPVAGTSAGDASNAGGHVVPNLAGSGYWVVSESGTVFEFGGAPVMCGRSMSQCGTGFGGAVVAAAAVPNHAGGGFWVVNDDGRVYGTPGVTTYGDWTDGGHVPVALVATPSGNGYYILESDGGISNKGDAPWFGAGRDTTGRTWTGMAVSLSSAGAVNGYWTVTTDGTLFPYPANSQPRQGYTGNSSLSGTHGAVTSLAGTADGTGFAILQQDGQVTQFPQNGTAPSTTNPKVSGGFEEPASVDYALNVRNESSLDVSFVPYTSKSTDPRSGGPGFTSTASVGYDKFPTSQTITLDAGTTSETWPLSAMLFVSDSTSIQTPRAAEVQFDVTPLDDSSDRQRFTLSQPRQAIVRTREDILADYQLLTGPRVSAAGSDSLVAQVEQDPAPAGSFEGAWTLVIKDADQPNAIQGFELVGKPVSAPYDPTQDNGDFGLLKSQLYRVDLPYVTRTWPGQLPGRIPVEPATVYDGPSAVGTIFPTSAPTIDYAAHTVTYGPASFYYQHTQSVQDYTQLAIRGGYIGGSGSPETAVYLCPVVNAVNQPPQCEEHDAPTLYPTVPSSALLTGLSVSATTSGTPAVPSNGIGAQRATLGLLNNGSTIPADDSLGWLYDHVFFVDINGELITGLGPVDGSGYTAVTPMPAAQVVTSQLEATPEDMNVWLTSSIRETTNGLSAKPMLSVLMDSPNSDVPFVVNVEGVQMNYATYDAIGSSLQGSNLRDGVAINCALPGGVETICNPLLPTDGAQGTATAPMYRTQGSTTLGPIQILTRHDILLSPNDVASRDEPLAMYDGALVANTAGRAVLKNPPGGSMLPSGDTNPPFSVGLVGPDGVMVTSDNITLTAGDATGTEPPEEEAPALQLTADDPPSRAQVRRAYRYTFAANQPARFEVARGALPRGLKLNSATGVLKGRPTAAGVYKFRIRAVTKTQVTLGAKHRIKVARAGHGPHHPGHPR